MFSQSYVKADARGRSAERSAALDCIRMALVCDVGGKGESCLMCRGSWERSFEAQAVSGVFVYSVRDK